MRDEQSRELLQPEDALQLGLHPQPGDLVQRAERLVEQRKLGLGHQRSGERHPHPHPSGELPRELLLEPGQPDQVQHLLGASSPLRLGHSAQLVDQLDVLLRRPPLQQRRLLENEAGGRGVDLDRAVGDRVQAGGEPQQRRLAASGRPDDGHQVTGRDVEAHARQRDGAGREGLGDTLHHQGARSSVENAGRGRFQRRSVNGHDVHLRTP